ncbi:MAG: hypothetical protein LBH00_06475 [Planctomycetaceae bacterium]|jgi:hypothetical protein|nr:hypothetical protein [Planctomycetaceae bacterium]
MTPAESLTTGERQRRDGKFYTPLPFAKKGLEYIEKTLGKEWWKSGGYRLWDMAAGTGNLESYLPPDALKYCYLSTLYQGDIEHLKRLFSDAEVFQYDYLNDDVDPLFLSDGDDLKLTLPWKMPETLRNDLNNPKIKWVILINPPFATAQEAAMKGKSKTGVSDTKIRQRMHRENLGEVSREIYTQFLYRIRHEFLKRETLLGLFAPMKYLLSNNYQKFRDNVFFSSFRSGFVFSSENFHGTSKTSHFPVSFALWKVNSGEQPDKHPIVFAALNNNAEQFDTKKVKFADRTHFLNKWIQRPPAVKTFPPFSSAMTVKSGNTDPRDRIAEGFLASLMCPGNELQNQQKTAFLSGPQVSAGAFSVTPENFEQAVVVFAARRIPQNNWLNHVDQLMQPAKKLSRFFITDCAVWCLFDSKNQTVSMRNVEYKGSVYQITNHFFPFSPAELRSWMIRDADIQKTLCHAADSFAAEWLLKQKLSAAAKKVLEAGRDVYRFYFANLNKLCTPKFKIESFDAGWRQIQQALQDVSLGGAELTELKRRHDLLRAKLLPQLYDYGIIGD